MRRIVTAISSAALALSLVVSAVPANAAVAGYDSAYAGESAFLTLAQGASGTFTVFFLNTGTTTWTRGTSTQVDLAACLEDKTTCNAQDATEAPFNSGWLSATKYATTTQTSVAPGQVGTFSYNVAVPAAQAAGTYRFNGAVVKADTNEDVRNEGYYQDVTITSAAAASGLAISPATDTNQTGSNHTVTVTYTNAAGTAIANASIDFFVVLDSDPFNTSGTCKRDTTGPSVNSSGGTACTIDITDPITNSDGKATFTYSGSAKETHRIVAWTGTTGDTFDNDTTTLKVSATKTWIGAVGALDCGDNNKNNPFASTHTVNCQLEETDGTAVALSGATVRYELYRGGNGTPTAANETNGCAGLSIISTNTTTTDSAGKATFSYTGPADPSSSSGSLVEDCIFAWYDTDADNLRETGDDSDTTAKDWIDTTATATTASVSPSDDGNPISTTHSVTATVTDQFGNPISGVVVRFSISRAQQTDTTAASEGVVLTADRTTGSDGKATLAYTGPAYGANDSITAQADSDNDGTFGESGEPVSTARDKHWADEAATSATNYTGTIIFCDTANDTVYVNVATGPAGQTGNRRFVYEASDQFNVGGVASTMANWETECEDDDDPAQTYTYGTGVSTFNNGTND